MTKIYPVLMVGGSGTRLWPLSRKYAPKQFHRLLSEHSLFQETILRLKTPNTGLEFAAPIIVGAARYLDHIKQQLAEIDVEPEAVFLEPCARSTTPVAALAARYVASAEPDASILLLPSDHHIGQVDAFLAAVRTAHGSARGGWITVFGIAPTRPETGFGYIRAGDELSDGIQKVTQFTEKPDAATALQYLQDPAFTWNSGIFMFSPQTMLAELELYAPETLAAVTSAMALGKQTQNATLLDEASFSTCPDIALDVAVMEKTSRAAVFSPLSCRWSDVGTWQAIADLAGDDIDNPNIVSIDNENCFIRTDGETLITALGLKDVVIIAHKGNVMILPKDRSQDVSKIVALLKQKDLPNKL